MSGIGDKDLVRVHSLDELRPGMTVVIKHSPRHGGRTVSRILLHAVPATGKHRRNDDTHGPCGASRMWEIAGPKRFCFCGSVREGRLYRLRDLDDADEASREREADRPLKRPAQVA